MKIRAKQFLAGWAAYFLLAVTPLLFLQVPVSAAVPAQTDSSAASMAKAAPQPVAITTKKDTFTYRLEGRPDPFLPFLHEKSQTNPDEIVDTHTQLTGMQLFEPGQLTLVALVVTPKQKFAMVQDVTGKGYIIKKGTKIGRRGVVKAIVPNRVIIEETAVTRSGRKLTNNIVMVLRKEEKKK
jgi:type IV pilus assembly protein PilP